MPKIIIKNGLVLSADKKYRGKQNILVENGKIKSVSKKKFPPKNALIINAENKWIMPGIIDIHVHARYPGNGKSENLKTAARAAARGGVTSFLAMPNTKPPIDSAPLLKKLSKKCADLPANIFFSAATTIKRKGENPSDMERLIRAGAKAFSDDGLPVLSEKIFAKALKKAKSLKIPVLEHCEYADISAGGVINESAAKKTKLPGIPREAEIYMVLRNILLASAMNAPFHIQHASCGETVDLTRAAKNSGIPVTAETCPHYFSLTEENAISLNPNLKMNPPLRTKKDLKKIIEGLNDGTIDIIASDHAPHFGKEKMSFKKAPFGIIGLETMAAVTMNYLVFTCKISPGRMAELLCSNPAKLLNLKNKGEIKPGTDADICVINPLKITAIKHFESKSSNSPFKGKKLRGWPVLTIKGGNIVYNDEFPL